jgi:hypothetical protein
MPLVLLLFLHGVVLYKPQPSAARVQALVTAATEQTEKETK